MSAPLDWTITPAILQAEIAEHASLVTRLLRQRRQLFDALMQAMLTLEVAEGHLGRDSRYISELMTRRLPIDTVQRSLAALEEVAEGK